MTGEMLDSRAREIIFNVDNYFAKERMTTKELLRSLTHLLRKAPSLSQDVVISKQILSEMFIILQDKNKVVERVSNATGISKHTVTKLRLKTEIATQTQSNLQRPNKTRKGKKIFFNVFGLLVLRNFINSYTAKNEVPRFRELMAFAQQELNFKGGKTTLRRIIQKELGYTFKDDKKVQS